jgi:hypothetical protein
MTKDRRKLFENHSLGMMEQVTAERAKRAGIVFGKEFALPRGKARKGPRLPHSIIKKLAGG